VRSLVQVAPKKKNKKLERAVEAAAKISAGCTAEFY
jgi:hypothetical protein